MTWLHHPILGLNIQNIPKNKTYIQLRSKGFFSQFSHSFFSSIFLKHVFSGYCFPPCFPLFFCLFQLDLILVPPSPTRPGVLGFLLLLHRSFPPAFGDALRVVLGFQALEPRQNGWFFCRRSTHPFWTCSDVFFFFFQ